MQFVHGGQALPDVVPIVVGQVRLLASPAVSHPNLPMPSDPPAYPRAAWPLSPNCVPACGPCFK